MPSAGGWGCVGQGSGSRLLCAFLLIISLQTAGFFCMIYGDESLTGGLLVSERQRYIRNFCIIAHIDHGKSTLADRILERTGAIAAREMEEQILDSMDLEQERGITIKAHAVTMKYTAADGQTYTLNLIDTPGHVDFAYEVSRSLAACEGALLVVDATQGVEAQTLSNAYMAVDHDLEVIPVINKIDLASADPDRVREEIEEVVGLDASDAPAISAKEGIGIDAVLERVIESVPPPAGDEEAPLRALIFDSFYDNYKGAICYIRVVDGAVETGDRIRMMSTGAVFDVTEVGVFSPAYRATGRLAAGEVGYLAASIKNVADPRVGDTITGMNRSAETPRPVTGRSARWFSAAFIRGRRRLRSGSRALERLKLNDASMVFEPETSAALGFGFRCGFLGLLHMEIIEQRLEREFDLDLVTTAPSVVYHVNRIDGTKLIIDNPSNLPPAARSNR